MSSLEWLLLTTLIVIVGCTFRRELQHHAARQARHPARADAALWLALLFDAPRDGIGNGCSVYAIDAAQTRGAASPCHAVMEVAERACVSHQPSAIGSWTRLTGQSARRRAVNILRRRAPRCSGFRQEPYAASRLATACARQAPAGVAHVVA